MKAKVIPIEKFVGGCNNCGCNGEVAVIEYNDGAMSIRLCKTCADKLKALLGSIYWG
jgi:hypothetical protein